MFWIFWRRKHCLTVQKHHSAQMNAHMIHRFWDNSSIIHNLLNNLPKPDYPIKFFHMLQLLSIQWYLLEKAKKSHTGHEVFWLSTMFDNVRQCSTMFDNSRHFTISSPLPEPWFGNVQQCSTMFVDVRQCSTIFDNVRQCSTLRTRRGERRIEHCRTLSNMVEHCRTMSNMVEHRRTFPNHSSGREEEERKRRDNCRTLSNIVERGRILSNIVEYGRTLSNVFEPWVRERDSE